MTNVKAHYKNMYQETSCRICQEKEESTQHLLECFYKNDQKKLPLVSTLDNSITNIGTTDPLKIKESAQVIHRVLRDLASTPDAFPTVARGDGTS